MWPGCLIQTCLTFNPQPIEKKQIHVRWELRKWPHLHVRILTCAHTYTHLFLASGIQELHRGQIQKWLPCERPSSCLESASPVTRSQTIRERADQTAPLLSWHCMATLLLCMHTLTCAPLSLAIMKIPPSESYLGVTQIFFNYTQTHLMLWMSAQTHIHVRTRAHRYISLTATAVS